MKLYRIYKCTNSINGKTYIGFTNKELNKRITEHKCAAKNGSEYLIHKSIRKYGLESFVWECLYESTDKEYVLTFMEKYFIHEYNSYYENGFGYNMTFGGQGGMLGKKHTDKTKQKLKEARAKRTVEPMLGKKHSNSSKEKMSLTRLNNPDKVSQAKKAGQISAEKRKNDPEYRLKLSQKIKECWALRKAMGN
jgi:group I intron endonuclease